MRVSGPQGTVSRLSAAVCTVTAPAAACQVNIDRATDTGIELDVAPVAKVGTFMPGEPNDAI